MISELKWMALYTRGQLSPRQTLDRWRREIASWKRFWQSYRQYRSLALADRQATLSHLYPCLGDDTATTDIEPVYFYQNAWAFEHIVRERPASHIDVGSHHAFVSLLSKVVPVTMIDIRPLALQLDSLCFRHGSVLDLPFEDGTVPSVSSLCVVEHIGLGRYGDPLDPCGTEKAIAELKRIVQPGGHLYLSIPIHDVNRVYFNAHRAFTEAYLLEHFQPFDVIERRYIYGQVFGNALQSGFGTGCYHLVRN